MLSNIVAFQLLSLITIPSSSDHAFTEKFGFWCTDYTVATASAVKHDRPLFILFCGSTSNLGNGVKSGRLINEEVERVLRLHYVRLHVDMESESGKALARRFQIRGEPSVVILDRTARWTVYEQGGGIAETKLEAALAEYRQTKLTADGRPLDRPSQSTAMLAAAKGADGHVNPAGYRLPLVRNIDESSFDREVVEQSRERTVIVDFWAEWCGPCRALGPILERQVHERNGEFLLLKVNVDHAPNLMARYRVESIPAVKIFRDGKQILEFVGMKSEVDLRYILDRCRPPVVPQVTRGDQPEVAR